MTNFSEIAAIMSSPSLIEIAMTSKSATRRAIAKAKLRDRIRVGNIDQIDHDAAEVLGLI